MITVLAAVVWLTVAALLDLLISRVIRVADEHTPPPALAADQPSIPLTWGEQDRFADIAQGLRSTVSGPRRRS